MKEYVFLIPIIYVIWYFSYAFLHEICHLSAAIILGKRVYAYQLIPYFWKGETGVGYVNSEYNQLTVLMPYIKDIVFSVIGAILVMKKITKKPFITGLALTILVFSSLFDITNNYLIYVTQSINDFRAFSNLTNSSSAHFVGILFVAITLISTLLTLKQGKNYPDAIAVRKS
ncbi:MAG: hypothetical protein JXB85_02240 [Anaerolineales bacterium]|nr:hypothetical protein [Anaerolineales bacterium]